MDGEVLAYYEAGGEQGRLEGWSLERIRTERLLERHLPAPPARVLDVGGGPGRYAGWLAAAGWRVTLLDPVPLHVEQASSVVPGAVERAIGGALPHPDGAFDAVVLLGPLYHLVARADRVAALSEARRVVRPGGVVVAAAISRLASLLDGFERGNVRDARFRAVVARDLREGMHTNPTETENWFTTAFFHSPGALAAEVSAAGLDDVEVVGVEGPAWLWGDRGREPDDDEWRDAALWAAEEWDRDGELVPLSAHFLAIARRPATSP